MGGRDRLDVDAIKENLRTRLVGRQVLVYDCTSSTNDIAWQCAGAGSNNGLVVLTEEQTSGRGRAGSKWLSGKSESILCSILLLDCQISAELLTLTIAVAAVEAIGRCGTSEAKTKWPNDIILNGKKVAGILLESKTSSGDPGGGTNYVIGIGVNCHQTPASFPPRLRKTATSLDIESKTVTDRISLTRRLLVLLDDRLVTAAENSQKIIEQWCRLSTQLGHRVTLSYDNQLFSGTCTGVDPQHGLILHLDKGGVRMFEAAQTSIVRIDY